MHEVDKYVNEQEVMQIRAEYARKIADSENPQPPLYEEPEIPKSPNYVDHFPQPTHEEEPNLPQQEPSYPRREIEPKIPENVQNYQKQGSITDRG